MINATATEILLLYISSKFQLVCCIDGTLRIRRYIIRNAILCLTVCLYERIWLSMVLHCFWSVVQFFWRRRANVLDWQYASAITTRVYRVLWQLTNATYSRNSAYSAAKYSILLLYSLQPLQYTLYNIYSISVLIGFSSLHGFSAVD